MMGKSFLCFVVVVTVIANAFMPIKVHHHRNARMSMQEKDASIDLMNWGRALATLSLTVGLYTPPAFAAEAVAAPSATVLKSVLNDYKVKTAIDPAATIAPAVVPPVQKVVPPVVKKVTPPPAAKKVTPPAAQPAPVATPAPLVYKIKPDIELLKKLEAAKKTGLSSKPAVVEPTVVKVPVVVKAVEKTVEKAVPAPAQKPKIAPAVAVPVANKVIPKPTLVRPPAIPEEKAVVEAYNKKSATKAKLDALDGNIKASKVKLLQSRSDMKKSQSKIDAFSKKLSNGNLDVDLRKSLSEDKKEEEKIFNQVTTGDGSISFRT
jgi:hypothetical protein